MYFIFFPFLYIVFVYFKKFLYTLLSCYRSRSWIFFQFVPISIYFHEILYFCYRDHLTDNQYPDSSLLLLLWPLLLSSCEQPTASVVDNPCGLLLVCGHLRTSSSYTTVWWTGGHDATLLHCFGQVPVSDSLQFGTSLIDSMLQYLFHSMIGMFFNGCSYIPISALDILCYKCFGYIVL